MALALAASAAAGLTKWDTSKINVAPANRMRNLEVRFFIVILYDLIHVD